MENVEGPPINDWLQCSICLGIYDEPTSLVCSHTFCKKCIEEWVKRHRKTQCPVCNAKLLPKDLTPAPSVFREMLLSLRVKCPNHQQGCQTAFPFENWEKRQTEHLRECQYEADVCTCGHRVIRAHRNSHIENECQEKKVLCPHKCGKKMSRRDLSRHNCVQEVAADVATVRKATEEQAMKTVFMSGSVSVMQQRLTQVTTAFSKLQQQTESSLDKKTRQIQETTRDIQALKRDTISALTQILVWAMPAVRSLQERSIKPKQAHLSHQEQILRFNKQSPCLLNSVQTLGGRRGQTLMQDQSLRPQYGENWRPLIQCTPQCCKVRVAKKAFKGTVGCCDDRATCSPVWYCKWCLNSNNQDKLLCSLCSRRRYLTISLSGETPLAQNNRQGLWVCKVCQNINSYSDSICQCGQKRAKQVLASLHEIGMDIKQLLNRQLDMWKKISKMASSIGHEKIVRILEAFKHKVHQLLLRHLKLWTKLLPLPGTMKGLLVLK